MENRKTLREYIDETFNEVINDAQESAESTYSSEKIIELITTMGGGAVGTKAVDETNIGDGKILKYDLGSDTLKYVVNQATNNQYFPGGW